MYTVNGKDACPRWKSRQNLPYLLSEKDLKSGRFASRSCGTLYMLPTACSISYQRKVSRTFWIPLPHSRSHSPFPCLQRRWDRNAKHNRIDHPPKGKLQARLKTFDITNPRVRPPRLAAPSSDRASELRSLKLELTDGTCAEVRVYMRHFLMLSEFNLRTKVWCTQVAWLYGADRLGFSVFVICSMIEQSIKDIEGDGGVWYAQAQSRTKADTLLEL